MTAKESPYKDSTGKPIPLEHFDNDPPPPDGKEPAPGSLDEFARDLAKDRKPAK